MLTGAQEVENKSYRMDAARMLASRLADLDVHHYWHEIHSLLLEGVRDGHSPLIREAGEIVEHLRRLGEYAVDVGQLDDGLQRPQQALNEVEGLTGRGSRAPYRYGIHGNLYDLMRGHGDLVDALRLVEEVLPQAQQKGWKNVVRWAEYLRGELLREKGCLEEAEPAARRALALAQEMKFKEEEVKCLLSLGQVLLVLERTEEAHAVLRQARRLSQEQDYTDHFKKVEDLLPG